MVDILLLQTVSIAIASTGVFLAAVYYILQIRHQTKMRQSDLIIRLYSVYSGKTLQKALAIVMALDYKDYEDFVKKYGPMPSTSPNEVLISVGIVGTFFEGVGVLLSERLLDINLVLKLFAVEMYWKKVEPLVKEGRKQLTPEHWQWCAYLYNEVKKRKQILQQKGVKSG